MIKKIEATNLDFSNKPKALLTLKTFYRKPSGTMRYFLRVSPQIEQVFSISLNLSFGPHPPEQSE